MDYKYERSLFPRLLRLREEVDATIDDLRAFFHERKLDYPVDR
jgi:hypothetical protein